MQNESRRSKLVALRVPSFRSFNHLLEHHSMPTPNGRKSPSQRNGSFRAPQGGNRGNRPAATSVKQKKSADDGEGEIEMEGVVSAVLAGTLFRVRVASGHEFLAHISGKMRKRFIRLVVGDKVRIEVSPYDMSKARITFRLN